MFLGESQGGLSGHRAGLGLVHTSLGVSSPSDGETAATSGSPGDAGVGGPGWNHQIPVAPNRCIVQKKNLPKG